MEGVEGVEAVQGVQNETEFGDILPVGFGDNAMLDDELAEEGDGRAWNDHGPQWVAKEGKKDGFVSTLTRMVSILPEGKPLFGGPCQKVEIEEVDVRPSGGKESEKDPEEWEKEIGKAGKGSLHLFGWQPPGDRQRRRRSFCGRDGGRGRRSAGLGMER